MLYRIVTNAKYRADIVALVNVHFEEFTVLDGAYYTKGAKHYAMVVEVDAPESDQVKVQRLAGLIEAKIGSNYRTDAYNLAHKKLISISPEQAKRDDEAEAIKKVERERPADKVEEAKADEAPTKESKSKRVDNK